MAHQIDPERHLFCQRWRDLARRFTKIAQDIEAGKPHPLAVGGTRADRIRHYDDLRDAGEMVKECWRRGWLDGIDGLAALVAWLDGAGHPDIAIPEGRAPAKIARDPLTLFMELVGNTRLPVKAGAAGEPVEARGSTFGGVLPKQFPAAFPGRTHHAEARRSPGEAGEFLRLQESDTFTQWARACELLADLIEHGQSAPAEVATDRPAAPPPRTAWLAEAMMLLRDHPDWPDARIAEQVGKSPSTLSRSTEYQYAARIARTKQTLRRGHIKKDHDSGGGRVEGYDA